MQCSEIDAHVWKSPLNARLVAVPTKVPIPPEIRKEVDVILIEVVARYLAMYCYNKIV